MGRRAVWHCESDGVLLQRWSDAAAIELRKAERGRPACRCKVAKQAAVSQ